MVNYVTTQYPRLVAERQKILLAIIKRRKLSWFGHVCCNHTLSRENGGRWSFLWKIVQSWKYYNIKEWTGQSLSLLPRIADQKSRWAAVATEMSCLLVRQQG